MSEELLPCPFCGGEAEYHKNGTNVCWIFCTICKIQTECDYEKQTPLKQWNTRPDSKPSPVAEVLEKISRVAHGEDQVGDDDTEGMAWIAEFVDKHRGLLADSKPYKYDIYSAALDDDKFLGCFPGSFEAGFNAARERG